jgi:hypothetical protein
MKARARARLVILDELFVDRDLRAQLVWTELLQLALAVEVDRNWVSQPATPTCPSHSLRTDSRWASSGMRALPPIKQTLRQKRP